MLAYISSSTQLLTGLLLFVYKSHLYISQSREKIDPNHLVQMYWQQWLGEESSLLEIEEAYGNFTEFKFELIAALSIMFNHICWVMFNICLVLMRLKIDFCSCVLLFCWCFVLLCMKLRLLACALTFVRVKFQPKLRILGPFLRGKCHLTTLTNEF